MTPPKITGQPEAYYNQAQGVCEAPEPVNTNPAEASGPVCSARDVSQLRLLNIDLGRRYASLYRNHVLAQKSFNPGQLMALAAKGGTPGHSQLPPGSLSGSGLLGMLTGCANTESVAEAPPDEPVTPPDQMENPAPIEGEHNGVDAVSGGFAQGQCDDPAALFKNYADNAFLMVCGDASGMGANGIESVDPSQSGNVEITYVPASIEGDDTRPVTLSSGAADETTQLIFAGLTPADAETSDNPFVYRNSGIYTFSPTGGVENGKYTPFKTLVQIQPDGQPETIPLIDPSDGTNAGVTVALDPNTPVSFDISGDTLAAVNMNFQRDQNGQFTQSLAPASVHWFTIASGGLTPKPLGTQRLQADGVDSEGHALILNGQYVPAAIAFVGDGRLAVLIRGLEHPDNPSRIILIDTENPGEQVQIPLSDSAGLNMWASDSNQLPIVTMNETPYALVGAGDKSGRVAMVNLDSGEVKYVGVFGEGHNVVSVIVDESGQQALAVSDKAKVVSLNLFETDEFTGLPKVGSQQGGLSEDPRVAAIRGDTVVVAHPGKYSKITVNPVPAGM